MNQPYPRLPEFKYYSPKTVLEALDFLEEHNEQSRPYAGGTDCFVQIRDRRYLPEVMVDLKSIPELKEITFSKKDGLKIGATASMNALIKHPEVITHYPILVDAANEVAGYQLRTRATVVGNICNASPCGDTIGACMVYGGVMHLASKSGKRTVPLEAFFTGPGKTVMKPGEIAMAISLPIPKERAQGAYKSIGRNKLGDLAIAAITVLVSPEEKNPSGYAFKIALTAVAPMVIFAKEAQALLEKSPLSAKTIKEASMLSAEESKPISDIRATSEYRKDMIRVLTQRGLLETCERSGIAL